MKMSGNGRHTQFDVAQEEKEQQEVDLQLNCLEHRSHTCVQSHLEVLK